MSELQALFVDRWPYVATTILILIGLWGMVFKHNLVKKLIGMNIFQGAIILFFIVHAYKTGASVPVYSPEVGSQAEQYMNPIPHGLMLTAIVVSVATTGVALTLLTVIHRRFGTLEEDELLHRLRSE
jgi:multicomponent Na+:H+ antiporter subunit C